MSVACHPLAVTGLLLVAVATAIALPMGVLTAIYVSEFAPVRFAQQIRLERAVLSLFPVPPPFTWCNTTRLFLPPPTPRTLSALKFYDRRSR